MRKLVVEYGSRWRFLRNQDVKTVVDSISLSIAPRQIVAVVGASGSGKTTLGHAVAGLVKPTSGQVLFNGKSLASSGPTYWDYRLNCQMIFQDPYSSLDPRMTVGKLVAEPLRLTDALDRGEKASRVREILDEVGLGEAFAGRYPHELSGGQRQRVAIARALVRRPSFVIADEPVSALDVTVRAQILELFAELQSRHGFSCLFISHDLGVVEQIADRVVVMDAGRIVEQGTRDEIFDAPQSPYTRRLLAAVPTLENTPDGGARLIWRLQDDRQGGFKASGERADERVL